MSEEHSTNLSAWIRQKGNELGFSKIGITTVAPLDHGAAALERWLKAEQHGTMHFMERSTRHIPTDLLATAKSLVVVAFAYERDDLVQLGSLSGKIARYARGDDYHVVLKTKLKHLAEALSAQIGRPVLSRACVDTAPLLERDVAARAGVGFQAKSTMTIVPGLGTYAFLGELLVDVELAADPPSEPKCGECTACLVACPTGAFVDAYQLDARRCISYLTIEHRGVIPRDLRHLLGTWVFGCDICQEVCPYNGTTRATEVPQQLRANTKRTYADLGQWLFLGSAAYRKLVENSSMRRAPREQLQRNAAVALGNCGDTDAVEPLTRALLSHPSPLVRGHAAWALGRYGSSGVHSLKSGCSDTSAFVREEALAALTMA